MNKKERDALLGHLESTAQILDATTKGLKGVVDARQRDNKNIVTALRDTKNALDTVHLRQRTFAKALSALEDRTERHEEALRILADELLAQGQRLDDLGASPHTGRNKSLKRKINL